MEKFSVVSTLTWLATAGGSIAAVSWLVEQFNFWHDLEASAKKLYLWLGSAVAAVGSWAILTYVPAELLDSMNVPFSLIAGTFVTIFIGERWHSATKFDKYNG